MTKSSGDEFVPVRPAVEALREIVTFFVFVVGVVGFVVGVVGDFFRGDFWSFFPGFGGAVYDQLAWGLTAAVAIMLSFYAAVASRNVPGDRRFAWREYVVMATAAEVLAAMSVVQLVFVGCFIGSNPAKAGALLVAVPVVACIVLLAVMLGRTRITPVRAQLAYLKRERAWARVRWFTLPESSRRHELVVAIAVVGLCSVVGAGVVAVGAAVVYGFWNIEVVRIVGVALLLMILASGIVTGSCLYLLAQFYTSARVVDRMTGVALVALLLALSPGSLILLAVDNPSNVILGSVAVAGIVVTCLCLLFTFGKANVYHMFSLRAAAARYARPRLERNFGRLSQRIRRLQTKRK